MIRTFLDSGVLIAAFRSRNTVSTPALALLDDPERAFVTTDYVRLEVLPKPLHFRRETEAEFYEAFFAAAELVEVSQALVSAAFEEADRLVLRPWMRSMLPQPNAPAWMSSSPWSA